MPTRQGKTAPDGQIWVDRQTTGRPGASPGFLQMTVEAEGGFQCYFILENVHNQILRLGSSAGADQRAVREAPRDAGDRDK